MILSYLRVCPRLHSLARLRISWLHVIPFSAVPVAGSVTKDSGTSELARILMLAL
jgi:hypothetical protein